MFQIVKIILITCTALYLYHKQCLKKIDESYIFINVNMYSININIIFKKYMIIDELDIFWMTHAVC